MYDYSCKTSAGVSLNVCLETGPPLQNNMLEILLRFRAHRIGLSADIEKAFHKIVLHESDRDFIRFLWTNDIKNPDAELDVFRFKVIPFGANCSPFILLSVIKHHLHLFSSTVSTQNISPFFYSHSMEQHYAVCSKEIYRHYAQTISSSLGSIRWPYKI